MPDAQTAARFPSSPARPHRLGALFCAALLACAAVPPAAAQQGAERVAPQPMLPRVEIQAGMHLIRAEVASSGETRMRGLMMRERLGPNEGMLFVFEQKAGHCFWMRNTLVPLSIAFLDDDGTIANIEDMAPKTEDSHCPARPIRFALEMEQGWFAKRGLKAGARLVQPKVFK
jgi:uncharacterized membrane protein (UPF0127 family)